jgi:DNA-binding NarL/FixJ family response regulator
MLCVLAIVLVSAMALSFHLFADSGIHGNDKIKVLIVDAHPVARKGIRLLLSQESDLEVCGEAQNVEEAIDVLEHCRPDLVIVDPHIKGSGDLDLIKHLSVHHPAIPVVVLSMRDESFYAERALEAGARAYITKEEGSEKLIEGIHKVMTGRIVVSDKIAARLVRTYAGGAPL